VATLKSIRCRTSSQWSSDSAGVMCSYLPLLRTTLVNVFWTVVTRRGWLQRCRWSQDATVLWYTQQSVQRHQAKMLSHGASVIVVSYSNFVRKTHRVWDIRLQKCCELENRVKGPWRSLKISPFDKYDFLLMFYNTVWGQKLVTNMAATNRISYRRQQQKLRLYLMSFLRYSMSKYIATLKS